MNNGSVACFPTSAPLGTATDRALPAVRVNVVLGTFGTIQGALGTIQRAHLAPFRVNILHNSEGTFGTIQGAFGLT